ncbi:MAG: lytic transglycosylase domain-containing protein [Gammaproteobacteria bacterium]
MLAHVVPASAEVYGYLDKRGHRYYTDKPVDDVAYRPVNSAARKARLSKKTRSTVAVASAADRRHIDQLIEKWAPFYTLDPELVKAVVQVESAYQVRARSVANAQGLMQLIPATAERFGVGDPWNAEQNLRGGMAYLQVLLSQFKGDLRLVLAAYNAGENNVLRYQGVPPFKETRNYLVKVSRLYEKRWHAYTRRDL